jgi:hypothetical protein
MDDRDRWAQMLRAVTTERASQPRRISELCVAMLGVTGAGVSMVTSAGNHSIVCATDGVAARIEDLQLTLGEGPCVDAVRTGMPILVRDLDEPDDVAVERWPAFMEGAAKAGVRAVFAFPLHIGAIRVGALDLYRDHPGELDRDQLRSALMAADAAALALLHLDLDHTTGTDDVVGSPATQQLQVHQATGMMQVQLDVTTEQAFLMLRARAFSTGRPLVDVAIDVVERRLRFSTEDQ